MDGTEPEAVKIEKICEGIEVSIWNPLELFVEKEMTFKDISTVIESKYPFLVESVTMEGKMCFATFMGDCSKKMGIKLCDFYQEKFKTEIPNEVLVSVTLTSKDEDLDEDDLDAELPGLDIKLKMK